MKAALSIRLIRVVLAGGGAVSFALVALSGFIAARVFFVSA